MRFMGDISGKMGRKMIELLLFYFTLCISVSPPSLDSYHKVPLRMYEKNRYGLIPEKLVVCVRARNPNRRPRAENVINVFDSNVLSNSILTPQM